MAFLKNDMKDDLYCYNIALAMDNNNMGSDTLGSQESRLAYLENYLNNHFAEESTDHTFLMAGCDFAFT